VLTSSISNFSVDATFFPAMTESLEVTHCSFTGCSNFETYGGGISIGNFPLFLAISDSAFDKCLTYGCGGGFSSLAARSVNLSSIRFSRCKALSHGQSFASYVSDPHPDQRATFSVFYDNGFHGAPMATDTFSMSHGEQTVTDSNFSVNKNLAGGSAAFWMSSARFSSLSHLNVLNNSCEVGRTIFIGSQKAVFAASNILWNDGGPLGLVRLQGQDWHFQNVALWGNERHSDWIVGSGSEPRLQMTSCAVDVSENEFNLRTENVNVTKFKTVFGANSTALALKAVPFVNASFAGLKALNQSRRPHGKFDKFIKMRTDDVYRESEVTLLDETIVCLVFPVFLMICFIWLRSLYSPRTERGTLLVEKAIVTEVQKPKDV
jgi:hypothetical protein